MHPSAYELGRLVFQTHWRADFHNILDVGSININGSLRELCPPGARYMGIDLEHGPGVDLVLADPYSYPFPDGAFDMIVSTSCFEHDPMFWLSFLEMSRVLRSGGILYVNVPSTGPYHTHPWDNWRFYPDAAHALEMWARRSNSDVVLLESFTLVDAEPWNDTAMIFHKGDPGGEPLRLVSDAVSNATHVRKYTVAHKLSDASVLDQPPSISGDTALSDAIAGSVLDRMTLADVLGGADAVRMTAGVRSVDLLASAGHYVRRPPVIFNLDKRTGVGAKYREDLDQATEQYPSLFRTVLNGAVVTGQGTVVTRNHALIIDSCWEMLEQQRIPEGLERSSDGALRLRQQPSRRIERPSLLLKRPWWRNYGHWLLDTAALLALLPGVAMPKDWQIVMGRQDEPKMRQIAYEALSFLAPSVPVLEHQDHETWSFDELHYTTPVCRPALFKLPQALAALRALVLSSWSGRTGGRKLYIARPADKPRRLDNEQAVIDLCAARGFEVVRPEEYSLRQQAQLFNSADVIVGVKGAALTNLVFCTSSASVVVLSPAGWREPFFWDLAGQLGIRYIEVTGPVTGEGDSPARVPFEVDLQLVEQALAEVDMPDSAHRPAARRAGGNPDAPDEPTGAGEPMRSDGHATLPDHQGEFYQTVLARMHRLLCPRSYLEIGVLGGDTLRLAECPSIAVDPNIMAEEIAEGVPDRHVFVMTSDEFFTRHDPIAIFGGPIDMAFLDGMHQFEFLLRDFMNTERFCNRKSCIVLHDCIPLDRYMAVREQHDMERRQLSVHPDWWTGDVWKMVVILRRYRPDLEIVALNAGPTGLIVITDLDPRSETLLRNYDDIVQEFTAMPDDDAALVQYHASLQITDTGELELILGSLGLLAQPADQPSCVVMAHIHNVGDVQGELGDWLGSRGSGQWVEGVEITPQAGIASDQIEYQVVEGMERLSSPARGGEFCGTRGRSLPIRGVRIVLASEAEQNYECAYSATFADGAETELLPAGAICAAPSLAPLESFRLIIRPRIAVPAGGFVLPTWESVERADPRSV